MKKIFYVDGSQIEEGDIIGKTNNFIAENLGYIRKVFVEDREIAVNLLSSSNPIILDDEILRFEELKNNKGYKVFGIYLIMKKLDWEKIIMKLLKKEIKELNYNIDNKYMRMWTQ